MQMTFQDNMSLDPALSSIAPFWQSVSSHIVNSLPIQCMISAYPHSTPAIPLFSPLAPPSASAWPPACTEPLALPPLAPPSPGPPVARHPFLSPPLLPTARTAQRGGRRHTHAEEGRETGVVEGRWMQKGHRPHSYRLLRRLKTAIAVHLLHLPSLRAPAHP